MRCNYVCPYAVRLPQHAYLLCKQFMSDGANYNTKANALKAVCGHQLLCPTSKRAENSESAQKCGYLGKADE